MGSGAEKGGFGHFSSSSFTCSGRGRSRAGAWGCRWGRGEARQAGEARAGGACRAERELERERERGGMELGLELGSVRVWF